MGLFDKIKDVIGDIAPIVLPVAINAFLPGLGTVASGALGAGIGTLLQGGDAKDALKSAALGGGIGALKVGFLPENIFFNGPFKHKDETLEYLKNGVLECKWRLCMLFFSFILVLCQRRFHF